MMTRAYELGLPFAILLLSKYIQRKNCGRMVYEHGVSVYNAQSIVPIYHQRRKKNRLPTKPKGVVELIWMPTCCGGWCRAARRRGGQRLITKFYIIQVSAIFLLLPASIMSFDNPLTTSQCCAYLISEIRVPKCIYIFFFSGEISCLSFDFILR